jgi:hypothetical protein
MAQRDQFARPMVRCRAGFHADETRLLSAEERDDFRAPQPTLDDDLSGSVDPVNLKPVLGQIETDWDSLHGGRLLSVVTFTDDHGVAHRCRGAGAVQPIKTDTIDAGVLAQLYASGFLPEVWIPDEPTQALRRQVTRRNQIVRQRSRLKNIIQSILQPPDPLLSAR